MAINLEASDIVQGVLSKINDPHNLLDITNNYIDEAIGVIAHSDEYNIEDKLAFLACIQDTRRKKNLSDILNGALPLLNKKIDISAIDSDWAADFFDKASKITTDDFQIIWSKILAEEANKPNSVSKRLLHNLYIMGKDNAETFMNLSRFCFYDYKTNEAIPIVFLRANPGAYKNSNIVVDNLKELEQLSLIECNFEGEYIFKKRKILKYTNYTIDIQAPIIPAGNIRLTNDGRALFNMIEKRNNDQILEYTLMHWEYKKCTVKTQQ